MTHLWWYTSRSSGVVAWALLGASVLWGLALSTKAFGKRPRPNWLLDLHRFLGGAGVIFVAIHVVSIVLDSYTHFGLVDVLVPLASYWHPDAVAWGIVGMYLLLAVEITSLLRSKLSKQVWHAFHYLSFPLFVVSTVHLLTAGTDRTNLPLRLGVMSMSTAVALLTAIRAQGGNEVGGRTKDIPRVV